MRARVYAGSLAGASAALGTWAAWPPVAIRVPGSYLRRPDGWPSAWTWMRDGSPLQADLATVAMGLAVGLAIGVAAWAAWGLVDCWRGRKTDPPPGI